MALIVAAERGWITRAAALERPRTHAGFVEPRDLLSRRLSAFHERPHRRDHSFHPQGRWRRSGRDLLPDDGTAVRQRIFRPRHRRGIQDPRVGQLHLERRGMGLVHPRPAGAAVALEPQQRLGAGTGYPRLERVSGHLRTRRLRAALPDRSSAFITRASPWDAISSTASLTTASRCRWAPPSAARCFYRSIPSAASIRAA